MAGCDGNNPSLGGGLIGTWKASVMSNLVIFERYQTDHTMVHLEVYDDKDIVRDNYTWKVDGETLITTDENGRSEVSTYSVSGNKLVRTNFFSINYTRCSDSEMDYYLEQLENKGANEPDPYNPPDPVNPDKPTDPDTPSTDCSNIQASYLPTGASGLGEMKEQLVSGAQSWFYDAKYGARVSKSNMEAWVFVNCAGYTACAICLLYTF